MSSTVSKTAIRDMDVLTARVIMLWVL
jgi:hypothetical protein